MDVKIQRWGNSACVRIPAVALKEMRVDVGETLDMKVTGEALTLTPPPRRPRYKLSDLISRCDFNAPLTPDELRWEESQPVGTEAWSVE